MAALMTAHIPGATKEMSEGLRPLLEPIRHAKGFVVHTNGQVSGGWRVIEVWDSQADCEKSFEASVKRAFSAGGPMPSITFDQPNEVVTG